jgi:hypothetical protein
LNLVNLDHLKTSFCRVDNSSYSGFHILYIKKCGQNQTGRIFFKKTI